MKNGARSAAEMGKGTLEAPFPKVRDDDFFQGLDHLVPIRCHSPILFGLRHGGSILRIGTE